MHALARAWYPATPAGDGCGLFPVGAPAGCVLRSRRRDLTLKRASWSCPAIAWCSLPHQRQPHTHCTIVGVLHQQLTNNLARAFVYVYSAAFIFASFIKQLRSRILHRYRPVRPSKPLALIRELPSDQAQEQEAVALWRGVHAPRCPPSSEDGACTGELGACAPDVTVLGASYGIASYSVAAESKSGYPHSYGCLLEPRCPLSSVPFPAVSSQSSLTSDINSNQARPGQAALGAAQRGPEAYLLAVGRDGLSFRV